MVLAVPATNRREIEIYCTKLASSTTFLEWIGPQLAYVSRSISRHFSILVVFCSRIGEVGKEMWPGKPSKKSPEAGVAMRGSVSVRGFDSSPFQVISGPGRSVRDHFHIFGGHLLFPYSPYYIPIPPVLYFSV